MISNSSGSQRRRGQLLGGPASPLRPPRAPALGPRKLTSPVRVRGRGCTWTLSPPRPPRGETLATLVPEPASDTAHYQLPGTAGHGGSRARLGWPAQEAAGKGDRGPEPGDRDWGGWFHPLGVMLNAGRTTDAEECRVPPRNPGCPFPLPVCSQPLEAGMSWRVFRLPVTCKLFLAGITAPPAPKPHST